MSLPALRRAGLGVVAAIVSACGYNAGSNVREISQEELFGLDQTTTTSTTTTTTTSSVPTDVSVDSTSTTTTLPVVTELVELYFLDGDGLEPVRINLTSQPSLPRVLEALEEGPQQAGSAGLGLRSAIPDGLVDLDDVSESRGVVTVDLDGETYAQIDANDELPAIAQIVLTLSGQAGVGQVRFTLDDEPLAVRLGTGRVSGPGEEVAEDDYTVLLEEDIVPPSTDPPPTEPSTETTTETTATTSTPTTVTTPTTRPGATTTPS